MPERLQKVLARAGIASRRKAEAIILAGQVTVNGRVVTTLGTKADLTRDAVMINGQPLSQPALIVYLLHKPIDVVSTTRDPKGRTTIFDLVPKTPRVFSIGRLDRMSEGLILLTNDGDLALQLTHPRYEHEKEYELWGKSVNTIEGLQAKLAKGARVRDGLIKPDRVTWVGLRNDQLVLRVTVHEGRKHLIRRLAAANGFELTRLRRIRLGGLQLGDLPPGRYRLLTEREVARLTKPRVTPLPG
ncbi:rRNA pseudouridine synthase [Candidatus Berkelbacteria bacterium]|nr:rRNA pseudouridine synthase [Candidatus Berkelbacteria bacterium]